MLHQVVTASEHGCRRPQPSSQQQRPESRDARGMDGTTTAAGLALDSQDALGQMCLHVVRCVRAAATETRSLRRVWASVSRDFTALLCGMRPAVMLDYVVLPGRTLLTIVDQLRPYASGACARLTPLASTQT